MTRDDAQKTVGLMHQMAKILAKQSPDIQGAILADALAMWLAGHEVHGDEDATRTWRAELLASHCATVRRLVPINAKAIGTTP